MKKQSAPPKKVLIVGAGFAGLQVAMGLTQKPHFQITLIDKRNHHLFQPLLYQVAMAGLSPAEIATPIRSLFTHAPNVRILLGEVLAIDKEKKTVQTDFGTLDFDYLVLACGAQHSYFNNPQWEPLAPGLKNLEQATDIRRRVLLAFEHAEREENPEKMKALLTFVVVGGGPTGVELAGALGELSRFTLAEDFTHINPSRTRIILIEAGPRILPSFSEKLSKRACRDLESLGVTVWTGSKVGDISTQGVRVGEEWIATDTVIWAAGVQPSLLNLALNTPLDGQGRAFVEPDLTVPGYPHIFVLGDQAHCKDKKGKNLPGVATVAIQQGRYLAKHLMALDAGKPTKAFVFFDKGQMATIGRKRAVVEVGPFQFTGFFAWLMWLFVHIYYLIGFKNRIFVLWQWAYSYFTFRRGARLIVGNTKPN